MKIFLAGHENNSIALGMKAVVTKFHPYSLFSYHYMKDHDKEICEVLFGAYRENNTEVICDSGLFTIMFGAGRGTKTDLKFWIDYAQQYIEIANSWKLPKLTIVECDVHKVLGMDAVWKLREIFFKSQIPVMYVWHREEGLKELEHLTRMVSYVAISVPEIRILSKGRSWRYQDAVRDLISRADNPGTKIHLLGNTNEELMKDMRPYSCDSTSWLAGVRFGNCKVYTPGSLYTVPIRSTLFKSHMEKFRANYPEIVEYVEKRCLTKKTGLPSRVAWQTLASAYSYHLLQNWLDRNYQSMWKDVCEST